MRVWALGSGSSGNLLVVDADGTRVALDAGIGPKRAAVAMRELGGDLFPRGVDGIVVTHEHGDHLSRLEPLARQLRAPIYLHRGIAAPHVRRRYDVRAYEPGRPFTVGTLTVEALAVPHDAAQVALRVVGAGMAFGLATDLGHVRRDLVPFLGACDAALVEANYCPELLQAGPYPPRLRERVAGPFGHLANEQTAELAAALRRTRLRRLILGHISLSNNTPERAQAVVAARAPGLTLELLPNGVPRLFTLQAAPRFAPAVQLALDFDGCAAPPLG